MDPPRREKRKRGPYKKYLYPGSAASIPASTLASRRLAAQGNAHVTQPIPAPRQAANVGEEDIQQQPEAAVVAEPMVIPQQAEVVDEDLHAEVSDENAEENIDILEASQHPTAEDHDNTNVTASNIDYIKKYNLNNKLCSDFPHTRFEVLLMIFHLAVRHCYTQHFVEDQIKLINSLFGESVLDISYYIFQQIFKPSASIQRHYFCPDCEITVPTENLKCSKCDKEISKSVDSGNYFVTLSLKEQIELILKRPDVKLIQHGVRNVNVISDIFDGELYQKTHRLGPPFQNSNIFTVTFNTDGVQVFESNKNSLWPIWLHLNELVPEVRFKTENLILGGLWFGRGSPNMALFLKPFLEQLSQLSDQGISYETPDGSILQCPVFAVACSVDSVAKPKVVCQRQFNRISSCLYCYHPNDTVIGDETKLKYFDTSVAYPLRKDDEVIKDMLCADELQRNGQLKKDSVNGFLGLSILLMLTTFYETVKCNLFSIVTSVVIDYLHCTLEGVTSNLLDLYESILTPDQVLIIDDRLQKITPPQGMTRRPRKFSDRISWKAKEFRAFLLYFALPCLHDLLPPRNFAHLKLFVNSIHILLGDKITPQSLGVARANLDSFVKGFQSLYGLCNVTYNLHLCTHLVDLVERLGPLWCYSNFIFESGNGVLVRLVRGTRSVVNEIAVKFTKILTAIKLISEHPISDKTLSFCSELLSYQYSKKRKDFGDVFISGSFSIIKPNQEECALLTQRNIPLVNGEVKFYHRAIRNGIVFCSKAYSKTKVYDDSCVLLSSGSYAYIDKMFSTSEEELVCLIRYIRIATGGEIIPSLKRCSADAFGETSIISFSEIIRKCLLISVENFYFVCHVPNFYERD